ncbi:protein 60A-like isoform X2 [Planococcus citri]|uniref:protein 60A-like isoform X2 n=1 Tax=Planococcus citri TaxID=170843 RepID=UPI0031F92917
MKICRIFVAILFSLTFYANEITAVYSGLYVDNGEGQTIREKFNSAKEKVVFEKNMLEFLGLSRKPRKIYDPLELEISAPKFLLDIYNALDGNEVDNEFNLKIEDMQSVQESDTIMTFLARNEHLNAPRHEKGRRLRFEVKDVRVEETILSAELRLYKICDDGNTNKFTVTVYEVLQTLNGDQQLSYVDAVNITGDYEGWIVFNVSTALTNWVVFPSSNKGLYFSVHKHLKPQHEIHPESIGIISSISHEENQQPFMVAFLKSQKFNIRRIRDVSSGKKHKLKKDSSFNSNPLNPEAARGMRHCQLQTLYVNFKDLNWTDWIISPAGYAAHYCSGACEFPLNEQMNATNHAIVQTLVTLTGAWSSKIPAACCVPTKLTPIKVLYYTRDETAILKKYPKMSAKNCGCH